MRKINVAVASILMVLMMIASVFAMGSGNFLVNENSEPANMVVGINDGSCDGSNSGYPRSTLTIQDPIGEVTKKIWDSTSSNWVDSINANVGDILTFNVTITYIPLVFNSTYVFDIKVNDTLPSCLNYADNARIIYGEDEYFGESGISGKKIFWNLTEDYNVKLWNTSKPLHVDDEDSVTILYNVSVIGYTDSNGEQNDVEVIGYETCPHRYVYGNDEATVIVDGPCEQPGIDVIKYVKENGCGEYNSHGITVEEDQWVTFRIDVTNIGDIPLDISVRDELPLGLTYDNHATPREPDYVDGSHYYWNFTSVQPKSSIVVTFQAIASECGEHINLANVTGEYDCQKRIYAEDTAIVNVPCEENLSIEKYVKWNCHLPYKKNVTADIGDWVTFKLYINNSGDIPLDISVRDELPLGLTYDNHATPHEPDYVDGSHYYWNFTSVQPGSSIVITFRADVNECGEHINLANVTGEYDCQKRIYAEDTAIVYVPCESGINVDKKVSLDNVSWFDEITADVGDTLYFKINVSNTGDETLSGVTVIDYLPFFLEYNYDGIPTPYDETDHQIEWFFSDIYAHEYKILNFTADVISIGTGDNVANATACGGSPSDEDNVTIDVNSGMSVSKKVSLDSETWVENVTASIGDTVRFNITISYYGPNKIFHIKVRDTLPPCLEFADNAIPEESGIAGNKIFWNLTGFLLNGSSTSIEFNATVIDDGENVNIVNVTADECSGIKMYGEDTAIVYVESVPSMICEKRVQADNGSWVDKIDAEVGDTVHFNITISNVGGKPIYGIDVLDILPAGLSYKLNSAVIEYLGNITSCEPSISGNELLWVNLNFYMGDYLSPGQIVSILFKAKVNSAGILKNLANITACQCNQCTELNCSDTAIVNATIHIDDLVADAKGPYSGYTGDNIHFYGSATGGVSPYNFSWDLDNDGDYDDDYESSASKSWETSGTYTIGLNVTDDNGNSATDTAQVTISIKNTKPNKPSTPEGETNGRKDREYTYSTAATDPQGDQVYYLWDWGDGTDSGWLGPFNSGVTVEATHSWTEKGSYVIKVRAKDTGGLIGDWSDPLPISMPLFMQPGSFLLRMLERLMENFPFFERILSLPIFSNLIP